MKLNIIKKIVFILFIIFFKNFPLKISMALEASNSKEFDIEYNKGRPLTQEEDARFWKLTDQERQSCEINNKKFTDPKTGKVKYARDQDCIDIIYYKKYGPKVNSNSTASTSTSADAGSAADLSSLCKARQSFSTYTSSFSAIRSEYNRTTSSVCELESLVGDCDSDARSTETQCLEEKDPGILQSAAEIGGPLSDIGGTIGMADQCAKYATALKGMNAAVGVFRGNCARIKSSCEKSCGNAISTAKEIIRQSEAVSNRLESASGNATHRQNLLDIEYKTQEIVKEMSDSKSTGSASNNMTSCRGKEAVLQKAGQNAIKIGASQMSAVDCNKKLTSNQVDFCKSYPNLCEKSDLTSITPDCSKSENATHITCICVSSPTDPRCLQSRTTGDSNGTGDNLGGNTGGFIDGKLSDSDLNSLDIANLGSGSKDGFIDGLSNPLNKVDDGGANGRNGGSADSGSRSNPKGSGPNNLDNVGNVGSGNNPRGGGGPNNLDTFSIGDGSGSGGGSGTGSSGSLGNVATGGSGDGGSGDGFSLFDFKKRNPADDKDAEKELMEVMDPKAMASLLARDGVTNGKGMSLFEKITRSYKNKRSTLIPE